MFAEFVSQNLLWVAAFVVVANLLLWSYMQGSVKGVAFVSALEMPQLQRGGRSVIVDVNEPAQYAQSHIPAALNFPVSSLTADNNELLRHKDKTCIIVCQSGSRSAKAARTLQTLGFKDLHILRGGLMSWTKENLPVSSS
ncbi:MAG: rhodanese-like domain-containing protein [Gammaproteobacteria bacterium]|nr:rhodanese-like domain-containing protein [Gammaproteobacteria bacterium]